MRFLLAACSLIFALAARAEIVNVDSAELARLTAAGVPLIDVRTAQEWKDTGLVPGSHPITFFDAQGNADPAAWLEKAKKVAKPGQPVALICRSGARSGKVSQFLEQQGTYGKVYNAREGIMGWTRDKRPVATP